MRDCRTERHRVPLVGAPNPAMMSDLLNGEPRVTALYSATALGDGLTPDAPLLFATRAKAGGRANYAIRPIPSGTRLFGEDDWADDEERAAFITLSSAEFDSLPAAERALFLRFAYNTAPDMITGTLHHAAVRHPTNFTNHACDPNAGYDGLDDIVALADIRPGEEIRMDYGTFSFSFDHAFTCACGARHCRGAVKHDDWHMLVRRGLKLPRFMRAAVERLLKG